MNVSMVSGVIEREPYYRPAEGDKKAFLGMTIVSGMEFRTFHDAVAFGVVAENGRNLQMGDTVYATGSHSIDKYRPDFPSLRFRMTSIKRINTGDDLSELEELFDEGDSEESEGGFSDSAEAATEADDF